ncbi:MAG: HAD family hydrolase [Opitutales bacterium]
MPPRTSTPTAVIWDMDGTLIDQTQPIIRCYAEVIASLGYPAPDPEIIRRSMGGPMTSTMALFVDPGELEAAGRLFREKFPDLMFDGLVILPGARELVRFFGQRRIPQVILTNKHGDTARILSTHCGFDPWIPACIGNGDTEWSKPEPELTGHALAQIGAGPEGATLIGDSPTDVATAQEAGIVCYGVATGAHSADELLGAGATAVFPSLQALLETLTQSPEAGPS